MGEPDPRLPQLQLPPEPDFVPPAVHDFWSFIDFLLNTQYSGAVIALVIISVLIGASISVWKGFLRDYLARFTQGDN